MEAQESPPPAPLEAGRRAAGCPGLPSHPRAASLHFKPRGKPDLTLRLNWGGGARLRGGGFSCSPDGGSGKRSWGRSGGGEIPGSGAVTLPIHCRAKPLSAGHQLHTGGTRSGGGAAAAFPSCASRLGPRAPQTARSPPPLGLYRSRLSSSPCL